MSRCCVANLTRMLQTSSFNQTHVLVASNSRYFPFLLLTLTLYFIHCQFSLCWMKTLREILSFTRSLIINTHPLVGCLENSDRKVKQYSVLYLRLLQVVLFTVRRYIGLIECVWFGNKTPDLYRETVMQHTLRKPSGLARMAFKSSSVINLVYSYRASETRFEYSLLF